MYKKLLSCFYKKRPASSSQPAVVFTPIPTLTSVARSSSISQNLRATKEVLQCASFDAEYVLKCWNTLALGDWNSSL